MPVEYDPDAHECQQPDGASAGTIWSCECGRWWKSEGDGLWKRSPSLRARLLAVLLVALLVAIVLFALVE